MKHMLAVAAMATTLFSAPFAAQANSSDVDAPLTCTDIAEGIDEAIGNFHIASADVFLGLYVEQNCSPQELADALNVDDIPKLCAELSSMIPEVREDMVEDPSITEEAEIFLNFLKNGQVALQCETLE